MTNTTLDDLIPILPALSGHHAPTSPVYAWLKAVARREVEQRFASADPTPVPFGPFGEVAFPYHRMGSVDTLNLFDLDELILFAFYWANRGRYKRAVDVGANLGIHSIVLARCGASVRAYEPDPTHVALLTRNLSLNGCGGVEAIEAAVSDRAGEMEFTRIVDNTTGSHLSGSKPNPYGKLDRFAVSVRATRDVLAGADFAKIDAEGHEKEILLATRGEDWDRLDAMVEVGSPANAEAIFAHLDRLGVRLFAQRWNWRRVDSAGAMPTSYRDGSVFVTRKAEVPWS